MAAARVISSASGTLNASLPLSRVPLKGNPQSLRLCFSNNRLHTLKRRLFTCSAIFNPQFQTKEEGQPETFDYRVFFVDNSGKKGTLTAIREWFRGYKIPDGKPANKFGLGNKPANKDFALKVVTETNESWAKLVKRSIPAGELSLA